MSYCLISPENFTPEHKQVVAKFKEITCSVPHQRKLALAAKDIHSRFLIANDNGAHLVGLKKGEDIIGMFDKDLPCRSVAKFAENFIKTDQQVLHSDDVNTELSILNVYEYGNGVTSVLVNKGIMKHDESQAILGVTICAQAVRLTDFIGFMSNYLTEFGENISISKSNRILKLKEADLTEYEHEVCFLLTLNWDYEQIADFMHKYRPVSGRSAADTIDQCMHKIREKLGIVSCDDTGLREMLIYVGVHRKMPPSFFNRLIGSHVLH